MTVPVLAYSLVNGRRVVTLDAGVKLESQRTSAPAGVLDIKSLNGNKIVKVGNDLYEPLDIATALGKI